jgi:hypothetical protein
MLVIMELLYSTWGRRKEKENDRVVEYNVETYYICAGRGHNDML